MSVKVDFAVCGRFHFHKYLSYIHQQGILNRFFYSYRINYSFGVPTSHLKNYFLKEYLMYINIRMLKKWNFDANLRLLHRLWEYQVCRNKPVAGILHVLIHGNSIRIIEKYKKEGKVVLGEVVNTPPVEYAALLNAEYKKYGLQKRIRPEEGRSIQKELLMCDYLLVPSVGLKMSLIRSGVEEGKILVLPYPVDNMVRTAAIRKTGENLKLVCVGQITFRKGQIYLLKAVEQLKKKGLSVEVTMIGYLDLEYLKVLEEHNLYSTFVHIPHVDNSRIKETIAGFDLLVLPSIEDGFGVVVGEALSAQVPVIVSDGAGSSEIIENGKNGFVVKAGSAEAIEEALTNSFNREFEIKPLESWENYSGRLAEIYNKLVN